VGICHERSHKGSYVTKGWILLKFNIIGKFKFLMNSQNLNGREELRVGSFGL
jgi:hypothetical protein